jgi:hypothetical protein
MSTHSFFLMDAGVEKTGDPEEIDSYQGTGYDRAIVGLHR